VFNPTNQTVDNGKNGGKEGKKTEKEREPTSQVLYLYIFFLNPGKCVLL